MIVFLSEEATSTDTKIALKLIGVNVDPLNWVMDSKVLGIYVVTPRRRCCVAYSFFNYSHTYDQIKTKEIKPHLNLGDFIEAIINEQKQ